MDLEEELKENKKTIEKLDTSIQKIEAEIEILKKAIMELEIRVEAKDETDKEILKFLMNGKRQDLALAEQHLTGLRSEKKVFLEEKSSIISLQSEERFQNKIKSLKKAIKDWKEKLEKANNDAEKKEIWDKLNGERQD